MAEATSGESLVIGGGGGGGVIGGGFAIDGAAGALGTATAHAPRSALAQWSWALCDGARVPYNVLVNIFVFSAYFSTVVVADPVRGQTDWSYISAAGALLVALTAPLVGAIADAGGRRKPFLFACLVVGVPAMASLWYVQPGMTSGLLWVTLAVIGGTLFYEYSTVFCSAMLPDVAPPGRIGALSGRGFFLGNLFGIVLFVFYLLAWDRNPHPLFGLNVQAHEPERAVGIVAAVWAVIFYLPLFFFTPDSQRPRMPALQAVRHGARQLRTTLGELGKYRNATLFLISRLIYNEGFMVLMLFTSIVAAGVLHWTPGMIIVMGLINSVVATLAGLGAGWLDQRLGSKAATMICVGGALAANVVMCSVTPDSVFFVHTGAHAAAGGGLFPSLPDQVFLVAQNCIAFFVTGGLVTSRALMAKLAPPAMVTEFFGLYALSGNATSFVGPLAIGLVTAAFGNQRAGVAVGILFLVAGLLLLIPVKERRVAAA